VVRFERAVLGKNDRFARENRSYFAQRGVVAMNLMSSPGAGKTTAVKVWDYRRATAFTRGLRARFGAHASPRCVSAQPREDPTAMNSAPIESLSGGSRVLFRVGWKTLMRNESEGHSWVTEVGMLRKKQGTIDRSVIYERFE
jgi:hypothetical protein